MKKKLRCDLLFAHAFSFFLLVFSMTGCEASPALDGPNGPPADVGDPAADVVSPTAPASSGLAGAADDNEVVEMDGTVRNRTLTIGGPARSWPPLGVSDVPPVGKTCTAKQDRSGVVPQKIPQAFYNQCAGCHGPDGAGKKGYPNILGISDYVRFSTAIRSGKAGSLGVMPQFTSNRLSEDDVQRIYAWSNQLPLLETGQCQDAAPMSDAAVATALSQGLAAWRTRSAGHDNVGCFQCHGADGLTFAYLGYSDGDVLRRAGKHVDQTEAWRIVDMVHAYRQKYAMIPRDPLEARPLQPGGQVLPGNSAAERDLAFGQQLQTMGLRLANGYINDGPAATLAAAQLGNINLHALKIPVPLNHLAEDMFHNTSDVALDCSADIDGCKDHGSLSDWMPIQPHLYNDVASYNMRTDAYLANPNLSTFYAYFGVAPSGDTMPGTYPIGYNRNIDDNKYKSQFILDYCIRREAMGLPGCYDTGPHPFDENKRVTTIWAEGETANLFGTGLAKQTACDLGNGRCDPGQAPHFWSKISKGGKLSDSMQRLRATWFIAHWAHFDPEMLQTGDATIQQDEYFTRSLFWANNDEDHAGLAKNPTYSIFAAYEVTMHNIRVLNTPGSLSCDKIPYNHPDLGVQVCTANDLRSGYYPQLCNFAEGKDWFNEANQQLLYVPKEPERKALYQLIGGNMYRMFMWGLINNLQADNWMCDTKMQGYRIARAKKFLAQPEIVSANGPADTAMFATLAGLMAKTRKDCPALDKTHAASF